MGKITLNCKAVYEDNIGDQHNLNTDDPKVLATIKTLDDLISNTSGRPSLHEPLIEAWDKILRGYSING
jgi:hypothetical protein